jgi:hypothetical protein
MTSDHPAWRYWLNLAEVQLEEAICLSLNFTPKILDEWKSSEHFVPGHRLALLEHFAVHYKARLDAARTHIKTHKLTARYDQFVQKYLVSLADFREWGESLPFPLIFPEEFPKPQPKAALAEPSPATNTPDCKPLNPKREKTLLRIIRALDALAELPDRGAANEVVAKLQGLGFCSPDDDTVRSVIGEARKLEPD